MFKSLFGKNKSSAQQDLYLPFANNIAAFEYACMYLNCNIKPGLGLPALVVDGREILRIPTAVSKDKNGIQIAALRVASKDGGFLVLAPTSGRGPDLQISDFVAWTPGEYRRDLLGNMPDERFGWVGLIVGTLEPEWSKGGWKGKAKFGA